MEGSHPQTPVVQEIQPEVKEVPQTPSTKPKKRSRLKILIILITALICLATIGFSIWKYIFVLEERLKNEKEILLSKKGEEPIFLPAEFDFGYCAHHGEWQQLYNRRERYNSYLNLSWERAMPGFANWQQIEPRKREYHWEKIDRYVRTAQEKNIQILFTVWPFTDWDQEKCNMRLEWQSDKLCSIPNSASTECGKDWGKFGQGKDTLVLARRFGKPCDMGAYKEFLRRMVERYDDDGLNDMSGLLYPIKHWEIGNEVDMDGFQGSAEEYFEMLKASYTTIKQTDPNAKVHISAMGIRSGEGRSNFDTVKLYELGAANYFDIMSDHGFGGYNLAREFLKKYGAGDKPIWVTEPGNIGKYRGLSEKEIASRLFQIFGRESRYGVEMFIGWGGNWIDRAVLQAITHVNYVRSGGDSDSFYDAWCGNKIVQEGEECDTMFPIIDDAGIDARKPGTDCALREGMAADCVGCSCVYHETVCGDNISEGNEECEIAWDCELIAGKAPTCEGCKCVYHEDSYCGNDIPEQGEECERDFECDEPPEGFEVTCKECKCVQSKR